jgi:hypothetical protein
MHEATVAAAVFGTAQSEGWLGPSPVSTDLDKLVADLAGGVRIDQRTAVTLALQFMRKLGGIMGEGQEPFVIAVLARAYDLLVERVGRAP